MIFKRLGKNEIKKVNLLNDVGESNWNSEFFGKDIQPSYVAICEENNVFAGCEGYIAYPLVYKGNLQLTHRSERTIVDGNFRGKGLFEKLIQTCDKWALKDDSAFSWGATAALKAFKRAGFKSYVGFRSYIFFPIKSNVVRKAFSNPKLFNPSHLYSMYKKRNLKDVKNLLASLSLVKPTTVEKNECIYFDPFDYTAIAQLLLEQDQDFFKINPCTSLFNWLEKKGLYYEKYLIRLRDEVIGYVVVEKNQNLNYASIKDIYFKSDDANMYQILLSLSKLKTFKKFHALFVALNNENNTHAKWIQNLSASNVINLKKAGSFVIKHLKQQV